MIKTKIYVPDIECDSCIKLLKKKVATVDGVKECTFFHDSVDIQFDEQAIKAEDLVTVIEDLGFRASVRPFERKSVKERYRDMIANPKKYETVMVALVYSFVSFVVLVALQYISYLGFLNSAIPNFLTKYGLWLLYLDISVAIIGATIWYMNAHKGIVSCMTGMMIGMTIAMQAGMMVGAVVGATNGFFTGSMVGITVAVIAGTLAGAVCGAMGAVQGLMSGIMAGTMGAMITVMMFTDHLDIFMPYYMLLNVLVLLGLIYIFFEEVVEGKKDVVKKPQDMLTFISACVVVCAIITAVMIYGPKSPLFA